jgi:LysM repeat protein
MAVRSPGRFLAPLALLAVVVALYLVVSHSSSSGGSSSAGAPAAVEPPTPTPTATRARHKRRPKTYTVKPGDTPSGIAEATGVPLTKLEQLNPSLDPQALAPGTKLKLR